MKTRSLRSQSVAITFSLGLAMFALTAQSLAQNGALTQEAPQESGNAEATEPVVVVTLGSINKLMQDINYVSGIVGQPQIGGMFAMSAGMFTQGIDMNQPIAVIVPLVNGAPEPIAMIPTADVRTVLKRLEAQTGPADELNDGTLVVAIGANTVFIRQLGSWAVVARNQDLLDLAPADPTSLFQGMGNDFDIAVRLQMQQVPKATRDMLIAQLRQGFEQAIAKQDQADAEGTKQMAQSSIGQLEQIIADTDELMFAVNINQAEKQIAIEGYFTAVPNTDLAAVYGGQQAAPSQFSSVIRDDAASYYHASATIANEAVEQTIVSLETATGALHKMIDNSDDLNEQQGKEVKELLDRVINLGKDSIKSGKIDLGALLLANQNDFQFVMGSYVSDGKEAAQIVKDLAAKIEGETDAPRFIFDQETYNGVTMHVVEADVPEKEDELREMFGTTLKVHIGTADQAVYLAVGERSMDQLKQLIDSGSVGQGSVGARPIGQLRVKLLPILQYAQSVESNDAISAMIDTLSRAADGGEVYVVQSGIENGQRSKVSLSEGLLQAIGAAARQAQQAKMQQNGQF